VTLILPRHNPQNNNEGAPRKLNAFSAPRLGRSAPDLILLGGDPENTILPAAAGVMQAANREIGVPGFKPKFPHQLRISGLEKLLSLLIIALL
jgi:hypothetical protein